MKVDERKKALELSRDWLKEEVKNNRSAKPSASDKVSLLPKRLTLRIGVAAIIVGIIVIVLVNLFWSDGPDKQKDTVSPQSIASNIIQKTAPVSSSVSTPSSLAAPGVSKAEQPAQNSDEKAATQANDYPSGWPEELLYPSKFRMVEANTIRIQDKYLPAYGVKMSYDGDMKSAAEDFSSYFAVQGWQIKERTELDSGAILIRVSRHDGRNEGEITIDPYPGESGKVRILAIVYI